jgi:hypothetical protein
MAYTAIPSVITGQTFSAANYNTYIKGNLDAIWVFTTAGDMIYATGAAAAARLALGARYSLLYAETSGPYWGTLATLAQVTPLLASQAAGDLPYAGTSVGLTRLALGARYSLLYAETAGPYWGTLATLMGVQGLVASQAASDLFYAATPTSLARLPKGTAYQQLRMKADASAPEWADPTSGLTLADVYPVGCIYTSVVSTNPATVFGFGTWVAFGAGKVLVGLDAGQTEFDTVEETGGAKTHTLSINEIPPHPHTYTYTAYDGVHLADNGVSLGTVTGESTQNTGSAGSGLAHNNLQPYVVVYFWKRTA